MRFTYSPTDKKGRYFTAIKFTIETLADGTSSIEQQIKPTAKIDKSHHEIDDDDDK